MQKSDIFFLERSGLKDIKKDLKPKVIKEYLIIKNSCKYFVLQNRNNEYFKTKYLKGLKDKSKKIEKDRYDKGLKKAITSEIKEKVYKIDDNSSVIEFSDFAVLISSDNKNIKRFEKHKMDSIFHLDRYDKKYLLLYAQKIKSDVNIYDIFKKIDTNPDKFDTLLNKNLEIDKFIKIKLYKIYKDILYITDKINKDSKNIKTFESYRYLLFEALTLIKEFKNYLNSELSSSVLKNLKKFYKQLNFIDETILLQSNLKRYKKCLNSGSFTSFISDKDAEITLKVEDGLHFFETKEFAIMMDQFESLIKDSSISLDKITAQPFANMAIKKSLKNRYKKVKKSYKNNFDCQDIESFKTIVGDVKKLLVINNLTKYFKKNKKYYARKHSLKSMEKVLQNYLDTLSIKELNGTFFKDEKITKCLDKNHTKKIKIFLDRVKTSKKSLKNKKNNIF